MLVDFSSSSRVWAVLGARPGKEPLVESILKQEGFDAYCPRFKRRLKDPLIRMLFPGYLFLRVSPALDLVRVRWIPGLRGPLHFRSQLACVEEDLLESWRERESGRGFSVPEPPEPFRRGQKVRVKEGPFAGFEGVVLEFLPARERVRLLLDHLGRTMSLELDAVALA